MPTTNAMVVGQHQVDGSERREANSLKYPTQAPTAPTASRAIRSLWRTFRGHVAALAVAPIALLAGHAGAVTITVTGTGDTIAVDGVVTLREAITAANTGAASGDAPAGGAGLDVIQFNIPGPGPHVILIGSVFNLTSEIDFQGPTAESVIIDGDDTVQLFSQGSGVACSFSNLTMRRANAGGLQGGAIAITTPVASTSTISNVTFEDNVASSGGAIFRSNFSNLILRDCRFTGNSGNFSGGAARLGGTGTIAMLGCVFENNSAADGGAMDILNGNSLRIDNCLFRGNFTVVGGGLLDGGAIFLNTGFAGPGVIANSTFFDNRSHGRGGALFIGNTGTLSLINVTMVGNEADTDANSGPAQGGALGKLAGATVSVGNSLIAGNLDSGAANDLQDAAGFTSLGRNFIGEIGTATGFNADDADVFTGGADLSLASLGNPSLSSVYTAPPANNGGATNTIALAPGSPLVDVGYAATLALDVFDLDGDSIAAEPVPYDQRGGDGVGPAADYPRVRSLGPDIGSFESSLIGLIVTTTGDLPDNNPGDGSCNDGTGLCSLRAAIMEANALAGPNTITFNIPGPGPHTILNGSAFVPVANGDDLSIIGPTDEEVTVDALGNWRHFEIGAQGDYAISNLILAGGRAFFADGGSILMAAGSATLSLDTVRFAGNSADGNGGAIRAEAGTVLETVDCAFGGNQSFSQSGGAISSNAAVTYISRSVFGGNEAFFNGGAIFTAGSLLVDGCAFEANSASDGGAIAFGGGSCRVNNSTFFNNSASDGGALYSPTLDMRFTHCTIVGNVAGTGGGAWVANTPWFVNSIVAGNTGGDVFGTVDSTNSRHNFIGDLAGSTGFNADDADPFTGGRDLSLASLGNPPLASLVETTPVLFGGRTRVLRVPYGSPLIDAGSDADIAPDTLDIDGDSNGFEPVPYDQRHFEPTNPTRTFPRVAGARTDIGAFEAQPFIVDVVADTVDANPGDGFCEDANGDCSLRAAIEESNANPDTSLILFNIPGAGPHTIQPSSVLPTVTQTVTIDATSEPDYPAVVLADFADVPIVEVRGNLIAAPFNHGLTIQADDVAVRGLAINSFTGNGIMLANGANRATLRGNYIGTTRDGLSIAPNGIHGIETFIGGADLVVGGAGAEDGNLISGNVANGINLTETAANAIIQGNRIGPDRTGNAALANVTADGVAGNGIMVQSPDTLIGGPNAGEGNIIAGNHGVGVGAVGATATNLRIEGNHIGLGADGTTGVGVQTIGLIITTDVQAAVVGGDTPGERNVISGNAGIGLQLQGADNSIITGNYIGSNAAGTGAVANSTFGIYLSNTASGNRIGGTAAGEGNVVSGNGQDGIHAFTSTNTTIEGNIIGLDATGTTALANAESGVDVNGATNVTIGGNVDEARNIISSNTQSGIVGRGGATGLVVRRNYIGLATDGITARVNAGDGIQLQDADGAVIGGASFDDRNVIVGEGNAITVNAGTTGAQILRNRIGASADGATPLISNSRGIQLLGNNATVIGNHVARTNFNYIQVVSSSGHTIQGNLLGTDAAGLPAVGFGGNANGVTFSNATNITFGGTASGEGNTLVSTTQEGIALALATNNVRIRGNSIYSNGTLGIDINVDGPSANDAGDADTGPNALQNYPTITGYTVGGTNVAGSLNSEANTTYDIDLFLNDVADPSGFGEGEIYIGSTTVVTDAAGNGTFNVAIAPANIPGAAFTTTSILTATATHPTNGTSEFSANFIETDPMVDPITSIDVVNGGATATCPVRLTITFSEPVTGFDAADLDVSSNAAVFAITQNTPSSYTVEVRPLATTPLPTVVSCQVDGFVSDAGLNSFPVITAVFDYTQNAPPANFTIAAGDVYGPTGLVAAMDAANCSDDPNTITLAYRSTYSPNVVDNTLTGPGSYGDNALPQVETPITIEADGSTLSSSAAAIRLFAVVPSGSLTLNRATLPNNGPANQGAAILNRGRLEVVETYFFANAATEFGGAIASPQAASVTRLIRCTFDTNTASMGGGALYIAGNVGGADTNLLENVTIVGNVGAPNGGAAYLLGTTDIRSSTITNNTAGGVGLGGGLYVATTFAPVTVTMANTIVAQNTANFGPDVFVDLDPNVTTTSLGYNLVGDNTFGFAAGVGDQLGTAGTPIDPLLSGFGLTGWVPTRTPLAASPARDLANPDLLQLPQTDARRVPRGLGALNDRADIGAVELNDFPTAPIENIHPAIGQQKEYWLRAAVTDANLIDNGVAEPDTINLTTVDGNYVFDGRPLVFPGFGRNYLPTIATSMTLVGNDAVLERGTTPDPLANGRFVNVAANGSLETSRTTWRNGLMPNPFSGGAMDVRGVLEATECTFENNASFSAGALFVATSSATPSVIQRSTLSGNTAQNTTGGAISVAITGAPMLIENTTISGNSATTNGGGIAAGDDVTLANVTVAQNTASLEGGGLHISGGSVTVRNTLVALNTAPGGGPDIRLAAGTLVNGRYNLLGNNAGAGGVLVNNVNGNIVGTPATPVNPQIGPLANNGGPTRTHELLTNSPAVDRIPFADPNGSPAIDQRSSPRPRRFGYDIGAYERFAFFIPCNDIVALRQAINDANALPNLDEIFFDNNPCPGGYNIADVDNVTEGPNGLPVVTTPITFFGLGNTLQRSSVGGVPDLRLLFVNTGGVVTINNMTLANGRLLAPGTGSAQNGGAILNRGSFTTTGATTLRNNTASFGGAVMNEFNGVMALRQGIVLRDNSASVGGALGNWLGGSVQVLGADVRNNSALFFGGAIACSLQSNTTIVQSALRNNRSFAYGGGLYVADESTNATLENVTLAQNTADLEGGGVYLGVRVGGTFTMRFSTLSQNTAPLGGGLRYLAPATIGSTIIAGNTATTGRDVSGSVVVVSQGYNLVGIREGSAGFTAVGDLTGTLAAPLNPHLSLLGFYGGASPTYLPLAASPALDAGNPVGFPAQDQRTFGRAVNWTGAPGPARPDIGAVEVQADTDRDGIPDSLETANLATLRSNPAQTNMFIPDSDGDGLIDGDERYLHSTNPRLVSTDADLMWDGVEVRLSLENPALAAFANPLVSNAGQFTDADNDRLPEALNGVAVVADPGSGDDIDSDGYTDRYEFAVYTDPDDGGSTPPLGDVDGFAGVTTNDALTIARFAVGNNPAPFAYANADPNGDAIPDVADVTLINLWLFGEIPVVR